MPDIQQTLTALLRDAAAAAFGDQFADADPILRQATSPKFGDFQANLAMGLTKRLGRNPREIAEAIKDHLPIGDQLTKVEVAGPGFINLTLNPALLADQLAEVFASDTLGVTGSANPALRGRETVVIDYASPNLAKEMHIGHLRSTIIGDAIARVLEFQGQNVIRQNHLGDWGTQFGMLLEHLIDTGWDQSADHHIGDLNALYREAKKRDDDDKDFAERARKRVVALQGGDEQSLSLWRMLIGESSRHMNDIFTRLGVGLTDADLKGESFYNDRLAPIAEALEASGVAVQSEGALCIFDDEDDTPLIVRKSDGGFGYAATDLAALRHRKEDLGGDRLIYVVDSRQRSHFQKFFAAAQKAGWVGDAKLEYVAFGTIMGKDNKPFKTRSGETVRLVDVLDEAVQRAGKAIEAKASDLTKDERDAIAQVVGIGAVKYFDLSNDRIKDYVFDWDRMLALEGNTSPYLQNAYVRIRSIFRKGEVDPSALSGATIRLEHEAERALALHILKLPRVVESVADSLEPHRLCTHLYELASSFHKFYEKCPVLTADDPARRDSRLALCDLVARTLKLGLGLLGIETVERM
jgi:arginyl-tRNA synthetase